MFKHYEGYGQAIKRVERQSLDQDLSTLDDLFGRDNLSYGATETDVKAEALRQLEIEWRENDY